MTTTPLLFARRITNLTDARYFAARDAAYLGFMLEPGADGYLDPVFMQAMREWVEGPKIIGEFNDATPPVYIAEAADFYQLDGVLAPFSTEMVSMGLPELWIKINALTPGLLSVINEHRQKVTGWVLELPAGTDSWLTVAADVASLSALTTIILQYDGVAEEVVKVLEAICPAGISIRGGEEEQVGVKSFDEVEAVLEHLI